MPGQKFVTKERITVRNLRIREDTAKVCNFLHFTVKHMFRFRALNHPILGPKFGPIPNAKKYGIL